MGSAGSGVSWSGRCHYGENDRERREVIDPFELLHGTVLDHKEQFGDECEVNASLCVVEHSSPR